MVHPDLLGGRLGNKMFQLAHLYKEVKAGTIKDIYVQDFQALESIEKELQEWFGEGIGYLPYVSIHVRRGDYVGNPFYCQLWETGYYINAINEFPDRKFLIFSDDIDFCKLYFEGDKFAFDDSENELDAFNRMASCESHIIANSSFSAWTAYLSPSITKKIIAPTYDKWYNDSNETRTILPKNFKQI